MPRSQPSRRLPNWVILLSSLLLLPGSMLGQVPSSSSGAAAEQGLRPADLAVVEQRLAAEVGKCRGQSEQIDVQIRCCLFENLVGQERPEEVGAGHQKQPTAGAFERCLELLDQKRDLFGKAMLLSFRARREQEGDRTARAIELYEKALATLHELKRSGETVDVESIRFFLRIHGLDEGLAEQAAPLLGMVTPWLVGILEVGMRDAYGMLLLEQGDLEASLDQLETAAGASQSALGLFDAQVFDHLGRVYSAKADPDQARESFGRARVAAERTGDLERQYGLLHRLAEVELAAGKPDTAIRHYEDALALALRNQNRTEESLARTQLTQLYSTQGQMGEAREEAAEAVSAAQFADDLELFMEAKIASGALAFYEGSYSQVIRDLEQALEAVEEVGPGTHPELEAQVLILLATSYAHMGQPELAVEKIEAARILAAAVDPPELKAYVDLIGTFVDGESSSAERWDAIRSTLQGLDDYPDAMNRYLGKSLGPLLGLIPQLESFDIELDPEIWQRKAGASPLPFVRGMGLLAEAKMAFEGDQFARALELASEAETFLGQSGVREMHAIGKLAVGVFRWKTGDLERGAAEIEAGLELFEEMASEIHGSDLLSMYLGSQSRDTLYAIGVKALADAGKIEAAFEIAERARARALLRSLGRPGMDSDRVPEDLRRRISEQRQELLELSESGAGESEIELARQVYRSLLAKVELEHGKGMTQDEERLVALETLRSEYLDFETTLVSYFVVGNQAWIWVVDHDGAELVHRELDEAVLSLPLRLVSRGARRQARGARRLGSEPSGEPIIRQLYDAFWEPIADRIGTRTVVIVPHRELHYLPFAALQRPDGQFLAQELQISYAPSAGIWAHTVRKPGKFEGRALVLGDPETKHESLNGARREASEVAKLFGGQAWTGSEATEGRVRRHQGKIDLLHLAAHGIYLSDTPRFSHVALAAGDGHDGRLEVDELFRELDLSEVDLVTLSACRTSWGEHTRADEVFSLGRGFLHAGSPAVLATLLQVDDAATAFWMRSFYRRLLSGASYAEAVQGAQLETRGRPGWADPHYWAGFVLIGDPHRRWREPTQKKATMRDPSPPPARFPLPR